MTSAIEIVRPQHTHVLGKPDEHMNVRKLLAGVAVGVVTLAVFVVVGEWALERAEHYVTGTNADLAFNQGDARLGWRSRPDYSVAYLRKTADRVNHPVAYSSVKNGFRLFGDVNTTRRKLLIVGDSFTQAVNVPTPRTYGALLSDSLDVEVFSYGTGGFGTLQELMALQEFVKTINPDVVLLQFCSNDFINNSYELESRSTMNNNRLNRPYSAAEGRIFYRNPFFASDFLARNLNGSRLFRIVANAVLGAAKTSVELVVADKPDDPDFVRSVAVTKVLIGRFRDTLGPNVPFYVFTADDAHTKMRNFSDVEGVARFSGIAEQQLAGIAASLGVGYLPGAASKVADAEARGVTVNDIDGAHWSEAGHRVVAAVLTQHLRTLLVPDQRTPAAHKLTSQH